MNLIEQLEEGLRKNDLIATEVNLIKMHPATLHKLFIEIAKQAPISILDTYVGIPIKTDHNLEINKFYFS